MIDILDYNPDTSQEKVMIFDSRRSSITEGTRNWQIEEDLVDFPIISHFGYITIRWSVKGTSSGRFSFVARSSKFFNLSHSSGI